MDYTIVYPDDEYCHLCGVVLLDETSEHRVWAGKIRAGEFELRTLVMTVLGQFRCPLEEISF